MIQRIRDCILILLIIVFSMALILIIWGGILSYKELPAISIVFSCLLGILLVMLLYWLFRKFMGLKRDFSKKQVSSDVYLEQIKGEREPIPHSIRSEVYLRSQNACENPDCLSNNAIHIHHIDMNNRNNRLNNLIALCPNCHQEAHKGKFTSSQLRNWVKADFYRLKQ